MAPDRASNFEDRQARFLYALGQLDLAERIGVPATPAMEKELERIHNEFVQQARWFGHAIMRS